MILHVEKLTRASFKPFGSVVDVPCADSTKDYPPPTHANQGSALRYGDITFLTSDYATSHRPARPVLSLFSCSPRQIVSNDGLLKLEVLEKHPYTSQTFAPLGLNPDSPTCFLIIVAHPRQTSSDPAPAGPDLHKIRAFVANGSQAVTYAAGTWHAPMIVIGEKTVNFLVIQNMNDIPEDNCKEVYLDEVGEGIFIPTKGLSDTRTPMKPKL